VRINRGRKGARPIKRGNYLYGMDATLIHRDNRGIVKQQEINNQMVDLYEEACEEGDVYKAKRCLDFLKIDKLNGFYKTQRNAP